MEFKGLFISWNEYLCDSVWKFGIVLITILGCRKHGLSTLLKLLVTTSMT